MKRLHALLLSHFIVAVMSALVGLIHGAPLTYFFLYKGSDSLAVTSPPAPIIMRFAGDCLLAGYYEEAAGDDPELAFRDFDALRSADIAMVNLECPITTKGRKVAKPFNFRMNPKFLGALKASGVDIVNIANNHIFDYGGDGLFDTIAYLDSVGIHYVGAGRNGEEAHHPVVIDAGAQRIGFLGYYGGGEAPGATEDHPGVARRDIEAIAADIRSLRARDSVGFVVVNLHWGTENADAPDRPEREFAHRVIDAGADAIIGHHPHVLQGIERYKSGVIVYSLGNFIFGGNSRDTYDTGLFEIRLGASTTEYEFIPIRVRGWKASVLRGAEAHAVLDRVQRLSSRFPKSIFQ